MSNEVGKAQIDGVVARIVAMHPEVAKSDLVVRDHTHEQLPVGSYSIAWEGTADDWTIAISQAATREHDQEWCRDLHLEPINGCILGVYDTEW